MKNNKYSIVLCLTLSVSLSAMTREPQLQLAGSNKILQDQLNLVDRVFQKALFNTGQLDNTAAESLMALSRIPESDRPIGDKQQAYKNNFYTLSCKILSQQKDTLSFLNKVGAGLVESMRKELSRVPHLSSQQQQYFLGKFSQSINTFLNNEFNRNTNASDLSSFFENAYAIIQQVLPLPKEDSSEIKEQDNVKSVLLDLVDDEYNHWTTKNDSVGISTGRYALFKYVINSLVETIVVSNIDHKENIFNSLYNSLLPIYQEGRRDPRKISNYILSNLIKYCLENTDISKTSVQYFIKKISDNVQYIYSNKIPNSEISTLHDFYASLIDKDNLSITDVVSLIIKKDAEIFHKK